MGWIMIDPPGTTNGPCKTKCKHKDCAATREMAAAKCRYCGKQIGYSAKFYQDQAPTRSGWSYSHASCAWKNAQKEQKKHDAAKALAFGSALCGLDN